MNREEFIKKYKVEGTPDNLTVGRSLYLRGTNIESLPEGFTFNTTKNRDVSFLSWQNSKYIKCDGMFTEVIEQKRKVWKVKEIGKEKVFFLVTDGKGEYAHGDTIKEAKEDLIFKISDRDKSDFEGMSLDSVLSFQEAITCYRVVTGACSVGVKNFVKENSIERKDYTIKEMLEKTKSAYGGSSFSNFFTKSV